MNIQASARIVWAIFCKDLVDAIKNKTILSGLASVVFVVLIYKFEPMLTAGDQLPNLLLYDAGASALAIELEDSPSLRVFTYDTFEAMRRALVRADRREIGLALPAGLDRAVDAGETIRLTAYAAYWQPEDTLAALVLLVEDELAHYAGTEVQVTLDPDRVYPADPGVAGSGFMVSIAVVLVVSMGGVLTIAHLMLEEKQTRTLDALRVSPAGPGPLLLGKALVGLVYCLVGVGAVLALNANYIVRWDVALLAAAVGGALGAGLGTLLGSVCETRQQVTLYGFLFMSVLLLPPFLIVMDDLIPGPAIDVIRWLPTSAVAYLVRASFAPTLALGPALARVGAAAGWTALLVALAARRVRRLDR